MNWRNCWLILYRWAISFGTSFRVQMLTHTFYHVPCLNWLCSKREDGQDDLLGNLKKAGCNLENGDRGFKFWWMGMPLGNWGNWCKFTNSSWYVTYYGTLFCIIFLFPPELHLQFPTYEPNSKAHGGSLGVWLVLACFGCWAVLKKTGWPVHPMAQRLWLE